MWSDIIGWVLLIVVLVQLWAITVLRRMLSDQSSAPPPSPAWMELVTGLLLAFVPTVALVVAGWVLVHFHNICVAIIIFVSGLILVAYATLSLLSSSEELKLALHSGQLPLLVVWSVIHFVIIIILSLNLVRSTISRWLI